MIRNCRTGRPSQYRVLCDFRVGVLVGSANHLKRSTTRASARETCQFWRRLPPPDRDISWRPLRRDFAVPLELSPDAFSSDPDRMLCRGEGPTLARFVGFANFPGCH